MRKKIGGHGFKVFAATCGVVQSAAFGLPYLGERHQNLIYAFPPIGTAQPWIKPMVLLVVGVASISPWFIQTLKQSKRVWMRAAIVTVISVTGFSTLMYWRLTAVPYPAQNVIYHFVVGWKKSSIAVETFGQNCDKPEARAHGLSDVCDVAMIQSLGPTEESVETLWTPVSLGLIRFAVLATYVSALSCWNATIGAVAKNTLLRNTR